MRLGPKIPPISALCGNPEDHHFASESWGPSPMMLLHWRPGQPIDLKTHRNDAESAHSLSVLARISQEISKDTVATVNVAHSESESLLRRFATNSGIPGPNLCGLVAKNRSNETPASLAINHTKHFAFHPHLGQQTGCFSVFFFGVRASPTAKREDYDGWTTGRLRVSIADKEAQKFCLARYSFHGERHDPEQRKACVQRERSRSPMSWPPFSRSSHYALRALLVLKVHSRPKLSLYVLEGDLLGLCRPSNASDTLSRYEGSIEYQLAYVRTLGWGSLASPARPFGEREIMAAPSRPTRSGDASMIVSFLRVRSREEGMEEEDEARIHSKPTRTSSSSFPVGVGGVWSLRVADGCIRGRRRRRRKQGAAAQTGSHRGGEKLDGTGNSRPLPSPGLDAPATLDDKTPVTTGRLTFIRVVWSAASGIAGKSGSGQMTEYIASSTFPYAHERAFPRRVSEAHIIFPDPIRRWRNEPYAECFHRVGRTTSSMPARTSASSMMTYTASAGGQPRVKNSFPDLLCCGENVLGTEELTHSSPRKTITDCQAGLYSLRRVSGKRLRAVAVRVSRNAAAQDPIMEAVVKNRVMFLEMRGQQRNTTVIWSEGGPRREGCVRR
ncbi:hypothetical protein R3P38DRAFT_2801082 [Favolaschia claudopus]|uniref:Uncharacterized protein n=1 Tax=Favolaschia claudopus TaxID=2862362 RepID=A0AAV9ZWH1_9AGAR